MNIITFQDGCVFIYRLDNNKICIAGGVNVLNYISIDKLVSVFPQRDDTVVVRLEYFCPVTSQTLYDSL